MVKGKKFKKELDGHSEKKVTLNDYFFSFLYSKYSFKFFQ